jgi:DNA-directed RNA polymerase specialized sigma24 family protein
LPPIVDSHHAPGSKANPQDSIASLVREHQLEVWRYLRYLGASPDLADDLAQETFVQLRVRFRRSSSDSPATDEARRWRRRS